MNTRMKLSLVALSTLFAVSIAACDDAMPPGESEPATASTSQAATTLTFDTTLVDTHPTAGLPAAPLGVAAFSMANVQRTLVQTSDTFTATLRANSRIGYDSPSWHAEIDPSRGQVVAVTQLAPGAPVAQSDRQLQVLAQQRLAAFGITGEEVLTTWQRRSVANDEQDGVVAAPELDGYKTFAIRGINRVRVRGHRAVVTFGADGAFRRALVKWPALAASGHKLRTPLVTADIVALATRALAAQGITTGAITLDWLYVPAALRTGEVTLTLKAVANVPYDADLGEARQIEIDVSAS